MTAATGDRLVDSYLERALAIVEPTATRSDVFGIMAERNVSAAPIVKDHRVVGIVSLTDLLRRPGAPEEHISNVMVKDVVSVVPGTTLREAATKMRERLIHRVLVIDKSGSLVGVLSTRDIMRAIAQDRIEAPLSTVMSTPVVTIEARDAIGFTLDLLTRSRLHGVVVIDRGAPAGVFTQLEALRSQTMPAMAPVEDFMSHSLLQLPQDTPAHRAASFAVAMRARRILAMDGTRVAGMATGIDLIKLIL
jgi:predicted transcriptional regulator